MLKKLIFIFLLTLQCICQLDAQIQILIMNHYSQPLTIFYMDEKNNEVKTVIGSQDMDQYAISPDQFMHLRPRFFELDRKLYQVKFSLVNEDRYKIEVWDAIKKPAGIVLGHKIQSRQLLRSQVLFITITQQGSLSLAIAAKKKMR